MVECFLLLQVVSQTRCQPSFSFMAIPILGVPEICSTEPPWPPTDVLLSSPSIFVLVCLVSWQYLFIETDYLNFLPFQNTNYALQTFCGYLISSFATVRIYYNRLRKDKTASLKELLFTSLCQKMRFFFFLCIICKLIFERMCVIVIITIMKYIQWL